MKQERPPASGDEPVAQPSLPLRETVAGGWIRYSCPGCQVRIRVKRKKDMGTMPACPFCARGKVSA